MLQLFESERFIFDHVIPRNRKRSKIQIAGKEVLGEFETERLGLCGAWHTFHVGTLKEVLPGLSTNLYRHLCQGRLRQARSLSLGAAKPRPEGSRDADHGRRSPKRQSLALSRGDRAVAGRVPTDRGTE